MPQINRNYTPENIWTVKRIITVVATSIVALSLAILSPRIGENLDAHEVMVVQAPYSGKLTCYTEPGWKYQGFGTVTKYPRRSIVEFTDSVTAKRLRFNDGGHAQLFGSVNWTMPTDCTEIITIHKEFRSAQGVEKQAVEKMVDLAVYLSGPMMSSTESSGERRAELTQLINDQAQNGVYQTSTKDVEELDPITGEKKKVARVEIVHDSLGSPLRQQGSILRSFGVELLPISIIEVRYDPTVEAQIAERQKATMQVTIAIANARMAEQNRITIVKQGEASADSAKWVQERIKATAITLAQQNLEVQKLKTQEAAQYKNEQTLRGEGDAARRRLVMNADGALDAKLEAWLAGQKAWAEAFAKYSGPMVPSVAVGGAEGGSTATTNMQAIMGLVATKLAQDLSLNPKIGTSK